MYFFKSLFTKTKVCQMQMTTTCFSCLTKLAVILHPFFLFPVMLSQLDFQSDVIIGIVHPLCASLVLSYSITSLLAISTFSRIAAAMKLHMLSTCSAGGNLTSMDSPAFLQIHGQNVARCFWLAVIAFSS